MCIYTSTARLSRCTPRQSRTMGLCPRIRICTIGTNQYYIYIYVYMYIEIYSWHKPREYIHFEQKLFTDAVAKTSLWLDCLISFVMNESVYDWMSIYVYVYKYIYFISIKQWIYVYVWVYCNSELVWVNIFHIN